MKRLLVALFVSLFFCMSCGDDDCPTCPGPPGASGSPPKIDTLSCDPGSALINDGNGSITLNCTVSFLDPDRDLAEMYFRSKDCGQGEWGEKYPVKSDPDLGSVSDQAEGQLEGVIEFGITVDTYCAVGDYPYEISARDREENDSNTLTLYFTLTDGEVDV